MSKIAFLLWSPDISGGTNVIFEHATRMRKNGDDITIITEDKPNNKRLEWFPGAEKLTWMDYAEAAEKSLIWLLRLGGVLYFISTKSMPRNMHFLFNPSSRVSIRKMK